MADSIEELLKQIQQGETAGLPLGGTAKQSSSANSSAHPLPSNPSVKPQALTDSELSDLTDPAKPKPIDHLLAEIEGKPVVKPAPRVERPTQPGNHAPSEVVKPPRSPNPRSVDALLSQLDRSGKNSALPGASQFPKRGIDPAPQPTSLKPNFPKPEPQPSKPVPASNPQPKNAQVEKQKRRQAIERQAQEWLKNLDPHGGDAHFFETLAERYPSRLEAAIAFLGLEQE